MCGTGTIPIEGAHEYPDCVFVGSDIDVDSIEIAEHNIRHLKNCKAASRVSVFLSDGTISPFGMTFFNCFQVGRFLVLCSLLHIVITTKQYILVCFTICIKNLMITIFFPLSIGFLDHVRVVSVDGIQHQYNGFFGSGVSFLCECMKCKDCPFSALIVHVYILLFLKVITDIVDFKQTMSLLI